MATGEDKSSWKEIDSETAEAALMAASELPPDIDPRTAYLRGRADQRRLDKLGALGTHGAELDELAGIIEKLPRTDDTPPAAA